ncbi:MAG: hypothetical protein QMC79_08030 [Anaerosomatales bacterium]|nr:hypothetical protein [Anaerosomatales bacterium]
MRAYAAWFAVLMGVGMIGMWAMFFVAGDVPELEAEPIRLGFHLVAEGLTAVMLLIAGIGVARRRAWARSAYLFAAGLLAYTVIVSPGYFGQQGQWGFVAMFAAFGALAALAVWAAMRGTQV